MKKIVLLLSLTFFISPAFSYDSQDAIIKTLLGQSQNQIVIYERGRINYYIIFDVAENDVDYLKEKLKPPFGSDDLKKYIQDLVIKNYSDGIVIDNQDYEDSFLKDSISEFISNEYRVNISNMFFIVSYFLR